MSIIIKHANSNDIADIIALMRDHALYERASFNAKGLEHKLIRALQEQPSRLTVYFAEVNNTPVGYCCLTREFSSWRGEDYIHMDCLFIVAQMRGLQIGKKLMEAAIQFTENQGLSELQWQTPEWNRRAIRFYQNLGARPLSKIRFTYSIDSVSNID